MYISVASVNPNTEFYLEFRADKDKDADECLPPTGAVFGVWFAILLMICCGGLGTMMWYVVVESSL